VATAELEQLLTMVQSASMTAEAARESALPAAVEACRTLELALKEALCGDPLRGLKNIGPRGEKLYAARIRTGPDTKVPFSNDPQRGSQNYLCISPKGVLVNVYWADDPDSGVLWLTSEPAGDDDLRIDDVRALVRTLAVVLPRHVSTAESTSQRYNKLKQLSRRICDVAKETTT